MPSARVRALSNENKTESAINVDCVSYLRSRCCVYKTLAPGKQVASVRANHKSCCTEIAEAQSARVRFAIFDTGTASYYTREMPHSKSRGLVAKVCNNRAMLSFR